MARTTSAVPAAAPTQRATAIADRFRPFGTTIFAEMTALANTHGAVNLAQGFPDFDGPDFMPEAVKRAMAEGKNQYGRMQGSPELNRAITGWWKRSSRRSRSPPAAPRLSRPRSSA
jgi:aspartate/methionine/tyrosine aminotransferase